MAEWSVTGEGEPGNLEGKREGGRRRTHLVDDQQIRLKGRERCEESTGELRTRAGDLGSEGPTERTCETPGPPFLGIFSPDRARQGGQPHSFHTGAVRIGSPCATSL